MNNGPFLENCFFTHGRCSFCGQIHTLDHHVVVSLTNNFKFRVANFLMGLESFGMIADFKTREIISLEDPHCLGKVLEWLQEE